MYHSRLRLALEKIGKSVNLRRIAITGSLASGKSTVCRLFEQWGAYVVSADRLIHREFSVVSSLRHQVIHLLGESVAAKDGIDHAKVAELVFSDPVLLTRLEDICHPFVNKAIQQEFSQESRKKYREHNGLFFVAEVPLLFESRYPLWPWFDDVVSVVCDPKIAKARYMKTGGSSEQFDLRSARQLSPEEKARRSTYVVQNNGTLEELVTATKNVFNILTKNFFTNLTYPEG